MLNFEAVGLFVNNMEIMVKFYRDVIGLNIDWDGGGYTSCNTESGISFSLCDRKAIESSSKMPLSYPKGINGTMEICFGVGFFSDVDKEFSRLVKEGAKPIDEPTTTPWGMRCCFVADPEGNLIEIWSGNDDNIPTI